MKAERIKAQAVKMSDGLYNKAASWVLGERVQREGRFVEAPLFGVSFTYFSERQKSMSR